MSKPVLQILKNSYYSVSIQLETKIVMHTLYIHGGITTVGL